MSVAASPCVVSPMWPACETVQLAALASPAVFSHVWQPCHEALCLMCKAKSKLHSDAYLIEASLVCQAEANLEYCVMGLGLPQCHHAILTQSALDWRLLNVR